MQRVPVGHKTGADFYLTITSHSNLELTPISRSINNSVNNTLQTFTVHKCHIKRQHINSMQRLEAHDIADRCSFHTAVSRHPPRNCTQQILK